MSEERTRVAFGLPKPPAGWLSSLLPAPGTVIFTVLVIFGLLWAQSAGALPLAAPMSAGTSTGTIAYQGRLADSRGNPLTEPVSMEFRLYNAAAGGAPLWVEQWMGASSVQVSDGLFNVMLGSLAPIPQAIITGNSTLFLGITVGADNEMAPRIQLGSVPFAVQALTVPDISITEAKLAPDAVTSAKIANLTIRADDIAPDAVNSAKILDLTILRNDIKDLEITTDKLAMNAITTTKIMNGSVTSAKLATDAVTSAKIRDGEVKSDDIFNGAVTVEKLAPNAVNSDKIINGEVKTADIADGNVTQAKLSGIRMYMVERQVSVDSNGKGCVTISLPSGRFSSAPHAFVIRSSIGSWEDNADYAQTRFIEMQRSTSSIRLCVDDDRVSSGVVGIAVLVVQTD